MRTATFQFKIPRKKRKPIDKEHRKKFCYLGANPGTSGVKLYIYWTECPQDKGDISTGWLRDTSAGWLRRRCGGVPLNFLMFIRVFSSKFSEFGGSLNCPNLFTELPFLY